MRLNVPVFMPPNCKGVGVGFKLQFLENTPVRLISKRESSKNYTPQSMKLYYNITSSLPLTIWKPLPTIRQERVRGALV